MRRLNASVLKYEREVGYEYVWIDTCYIDAQSSVESSEAIDFMNI